MKPALNPLLKPYKKVFMKPLTVLSLFSLILSLTAIGFAYVSKLAIDHYESTSKLVLFGGVLVLIMVIQLGLSTFNQYYKAKSTYRLESIMRADLYEILLHSKLQDSSNAHSAVYINHFKADLTTISDGVYDLIPKVIFYVGRFLGAFIVLFILDSLFAFLFFGLGCLLLLISRLLSKPIKAIQKAALVAEDQLYTTLQEGLTHIEVIKAFEAEHLQQQALEKDSTDFYLKRLKKQVITAFTSLGLHSFFAFGYVFAILFGAYRLNQGTLVFGSLVAIIQLVQNIQSPFSGLSTLVVKYHQWGTSIDRVVALSKLEVESKTQVPIQPFKKIEFKNVSFKYDSNWVIERLNFDIKPNELIWIKGESGNGKTTLIKLLLGLYTPTEGSITLKLDESNYALSESTRGYFSYVPQSHFMMSQSILENLTLGHDISMDTVIKMCQIAMIYNDILETQSGFQTPLKEMGAGLSIGQLARLSLARALLKDAPILLLDELTAALDSDTEKKVLMNLKTLKQKTIIFVSHRDLKEIKPTKIIEL